MLRNLTKTAFACAYTWTGAGRVNSPALPFIVGYHRVVEDFDRSSRHAIPSLLITTRMLEQHIDWLARRFQLVSLDEIGRALESGRSFSRPAASITFDDGYADFYHLAYPLLRRKGIPAAVFVVTDLVGTSRAQIYDRLYIALSQRRSGEDTLEQMTSLLVRHSQEEIERIIADLQGTHSISKDLAAEMAPLTWEMIAEMQPNGITIGSHTKSHTLLTSESLTRARMELAGSKQALEDRLRAPVNHFAYPDGRFNPAVVHAVADAGYRFAYGICRTQDKDFPLLTIPRKVLWEKSCLNALGRFSPSVMNCHAHWALDGKRACGHDHLGNNKHVSIN